MKNGLVVGSFILETPACTAVTNAQGDMVVTVSNLIAGSGANQPLSYSVSFPGFIMGPAAKTNFVNP
jgi:hypothetical protein